MTAPEYDAEAEAERLWHEIWTTIEDDVPTFAVGPYPPYQKVKAFEARLSDALRRAYQAGAASRRRTPRRGARSLSP